MPNVIPGNPPASPALNQVTRIKYKIHNLRLLFTIE